MTPEDENPWRKAMLNKCMVCHVAFYEDSPSKTLTNIIEWHWETALDPAVSEDAQALIGRAQPDALKRIAELEKIVKVLEKELNKAYRKVNGIDPI